MNGICENQVALEWTGQVDSREAFEAFVHTHMKQAYSVALGLVGNHEDALELSQEAFARAYQYRDTLNAQRKFFPWFYQILRNLCFSHLRKRKVRQADSLDADPETPMQVQARDGFDPEALAEQNETTARLWRAIGQLDEKHREVIILRHFQNLSYDQMATLLFCNKGTVTSRLYYARQQLKEILDDEKGGQGA
ncbi:MAG: RNA polymerase sigma factor [Phycisphaerae bacterium]|nr:RNA polymerase sigma factor [Phycisphaerae bacterium]